MLHDDSLRHVRSANLVASRLRERPDSKTLVAFARFLLETDARKSENYLNRYNTRNCRDLGGEAHAPTVGMLIRGDGNEEAQGQHNQIPKE